MMNGFPETSQALLRKIVAQTTGESEAAWVRFFDLYTPAIRNFVVAHDQVHDPEDVVQDIYLKLVKAIQSGRYHFEKGKFRMFLATLIRCHLVSLYRKDQARDVGTRVPLSSARLAVPASVSAALDAKWRLARHQSAVEHVLTKTALSAQSRAVYRAYVLEGRSLDDVEQEFGLTKMAIYKIKSRIDKMVAIVEEELVDK